jgi:O-antigen ligase
LWLLTLPGEGALYQLSIYLLPLLALLHRASRQQLWQLLGRHRLALLLLAAPLSLAALSAALRSGASPDPELLREFIWRLGVVALAGAALLRQHRIALPAVLLLLWLSATGHSLIALWQVATATGISHVLQFSGRAGGMADSPNELGLLLVLGLLCGWQLRSARPPLNLLLLAAALPQLLLLLLSGSRSAWLALLAAALATLLLTPRAPWRWRHLWLGAGALALLLALSAQVPGVLQRLPGLFSDPARTAIWSHFLQVWQAHWLSGVYDLHDHAFTHPLTQRVYHNPHGVINDIAVRSGLIGLAVFALALGTAARDFYRSPHRACLLPLLAAVVVGCLFSFSLYAKIFAQGLYALLLMLWLTYAQPGCTPQPTAQPQAGAG